MGENEKKINSTVMYFTLRGVPAGGSSVWRVEFYKQKD